MADFVYEIDIPNRGTVRVSSPSELSDQQAYEMALSKPYSAGEVVSGAVTNLPSSLGNIAKGLYEAVTSPVQTAKGVMDLGAGALQNLLPENIVQFVGEDKASRDIASSVGKFYADRYGSVEGAKRAFATDPAGVMADLSTFLTGGRTIAPRAASVLMSTAAKEANLAALRGISRIPGTAGDVTKGVYQAVTQPLEKVTLPGVIGYIDPLQLTAKAVGAAGKAVAPIVGMTTGVGTEAARQAVRAGLEGGDIAEMFKQNLRGNVPTDAVLDAARQNLEVMSANKQAQYRANMAAVKADTSILNFSGIDNSLKNAQNLVTFKGQVTNKPGANVLAQIDAEVANWKSLNPAEYHTPEGLDNLKKVVGGILENIPPNEKVAYAAAKNVYDSIKKEITKQAPEYAKAMKDYSEASDLIREIERALSLGQKSSADTAMRKLQSLMRNNVQTNYGQRIALARQLEAAGGREMMPALAGQAMSEFAPRGLQRASTIPSGFLAYGAGGIPAAAGMAAVSSPRLMGETLYGAGVFGRGVSNVTARLPQANYPAALNLGYQAGMLGGDISFAEDRKRRERAGLLSGQVQ